MATGSTTETNDDRRSTTAGARSVLRAAAGAVRRTLGRLRPRDPLLESFDESRPDDPDSGDPLGDGDPFLPQCLAGGDASAGTYHHNQRSLEEMQRDR